MTPRFAPAFALLALTSACDPDCPGLRLEYDGTQSGPVFAVFRYGTRTSVYRYDSVAAARDALSGAPCSPGGTRLFGRGELAAGATFTAWIDLNGNASMQCDTSTMPLSAACGPDAMEPSGSLPPQPFGAVITVVIRDP